MDKGQFLLYQTPDGVSKIEVKLQDDTVWLSLDQMAELFQRNKSTISRHIKNVLEEGELLADSTIANFATVQNEGKRHVERQITYYNLDMIISVGYRVHSYRGVQFRIWATKVLKDYIVKGFALNDDLLKRAGGGNYFDELLARIRDIRSSEKVFYRKILEIYALSIDILYMGIPQRKSSMNVQMPKKISWDSPLGQVLCLQSQKPRLRRIISHKTRLNR
jgi:hypothetical protein